MVRDTEDGAGADKQSLSPSSMGRLVARVRVIAAVLPSSARLLSANALIAASTFLTGVLLAWALNPSGRGSLANILLWPAFFSQINLWGVHVFLAREVAARPTAAAEYYSLARRALWPCCGLAGFMYVAMVVGGGDKAFATLGIGAIVAAAILIPLSSFSAMQMQMELGRSSFGIFSWSKLSFAAGNLIAVAALWVAGSQVFEYFLWGFIAAAAFSVGSTYFLVRRSLPGQVSSGTIETDLPSLFRTSWPYAFSTGVLAVATSADRLIISLAFDAHVLGLYVIALSLSQVQAIVNDAVSTQFFAKVAKQSHVSGVDGNWLALRLRQSVLINAAISALLMMAAPVLIPLIYGAAYQGAIDVVYLLVPAMSLRSMMQPFQEVLKGGNKPLDQSFGVLGMTVLFGLCATPALIFQSVRGVALALLVSAIGGLLILAHFVSKDSGLAVRHLLVPRPSDAALLTAEILRVARF